MTDLSDHPMAIFHAGESYESPSERQWLAWCKKVERLLGHSLDGDDSLGNDAWPASGDGYSLDEAYGWWEAGDAPADYAREIQSRHRYRLRKDDELRDHYRAKWEQDR